MYCSHCGAKNNDTAQYCRECGKPLAQPNQPSNDSAFEHELAAGKKRESVGQFLRAFQAHVSPQASNYNEISAQCARMHGIEQQRARLEKSARSIVLSIVGIALIALGIAMICSFVSYMQAHIDEVAIIENPTLADYIENIAALSIFAWPILIGIVCIVVFVLRKIRTPKKLAQLAEEYDEAKSRAQQAAQEIQRNYEAFPNHQLVAFKYANPWLLDSLARIVADGKADTLTQAIQYFENESYQQEMKGIANASLYATQEILERTKSIQHQLVYIGAVSTVGAVGAWRR